MSNFKKQNDENLWNYVESCCLRPDFYRKHYFDFYHLIEAEKSEQRRAKMQNDLARAMGESHFMDWSHPKDRAEMELAGLRLGPPLASQEVASPQNEPSRPRFDGLRRFISHMQKI
ncbi:hypothetical protein LMG28614_05644 [Paraburkholderia ultramafica]|uniref:Uncharacterized protein n=1 Tax=Paraburkholderia ultramafica TaxID=1544867 RepID=A0A6S7BTZ1_9BURK|nr:hypothetical protein [Paraburkholderia ultramafica]CAB3802567.1 hypothetical protein LMG28614_05644 [Paraburkholderia ultramafica]